MQFSNIVAVAGYLALALENPLSLEDRSKKPNCPCASPKCLTSVKRPFATDRIVPDLIERINPTLSIAVSYGSKQVQLGTYFTTVETLNAPTLSISAEANHDPAKTTYSLFLIDPDVPQDGSAAQTNFCHWIISGIHPNCVNNATAQQTVDIYEALTPASTTQHRCTFLVYREPPGYVPDVVTLQVRTPFDINDYVEATGLILVGGNFLKEAITNGLQNPPPPK